MIRFVKKMVSLCLAGGLVACGSSSSAPDGIGGAGAGGAGGAAGAGGGAALTVSPFLGDWTADPGSSWTHTCPGMADSKSGFAGAMVTILALPEPNIRFHIPSNGCSFDLATSGDTATILPNQGCDGTNTPLGTTSEKRDTMVAMTTDGKTMSYTSSSTFTNGCTGSVTSTMTHQ